jgi:hypothetical protein
MSGIASIFPTPPSGNGWLLMDWNGNDSKAGSIKRETRSPVRGKKGSILTAYLTPLPRTRVNCVDEMGPLAVKTYPGDDWVAGPNRATYELDYARTGSFGHMVLLNLLLGEQQFR